MDLSNTKYGVIIIHTVRKQFYGYTKQGVEKAKLERELKGMFDHPYNREYKYMARNKNIPNCPIIIH